MSKFKALITALVLGSSSAAMAAPSVSFSAEASWGTVSPTVRDHRDQRTVTTYPAFEAPTSRFARGTWISLAEPMNSRRGQSVIDIDSRAKLNQIRLQSASGASYIGTVTIRFVGGASQVITLNQWLDARNPMAQFNLNRTTQVDSILISGARNRRGGTYQVFGYAASTRPTPPIYQPERPPVYQPPVYQPPGLVLATNMTFQNTDGRKFLTVGAEKGAYSTLRLQGNSGATFIEQVVVEFTNGQTQLMSNVDRTLFAGQIVDLRLDGAGRNSIKRIVVYNNENGVPSSNAGEFTATLL